MKGKLERHRKSRRTGTRGALDISDVVHSGNPTCTKSTTRAVSLTCKADERSFLRVSKTRQLVSVLLFFALVLCWTNVGAVTLPPERGCAFYTKGGYTGDYRIRAIGQTAAVNGGDTTRFRSWVCGTFAAVRYQPRYTAQGKGGTARAIPSAMNLPPQNFLVVARRPSDVEMEIWMANRALQGVVAQQSLEIRKEIRPIGKSVRDFIGTFNVYIKKTLTEVIKAVMATAVKELEKAKKKG